MDYSTYCWGSCMLPKVSGCSSTMIDTRKSRNFRASPDPVIGSWQLHGNDIGVRF